MDYYALCSELITTDVSGAPLCSSGWFSVAHSSFFPAISMADGNLILAAVAGLWALAWGFKQIARFLLNR